MVLRSGLLLLFAAASPAFGQTVSELNRQIATIRTVEEIALSPNGQTVASIITDSTVAGGHKHLWLLSAKASPRQLTGMASDSGVDDSKPLWSPDGTRLFYLEKAEGRAAVRRVELTSGRNDVLSLERQGSVVTSGWRDSMAMRSLVAKGFAIAPSGMIAVWATDESDAAEEATQKEDQHVVGMRDPVRLFLVEEGKPTREVSLPEDARYAAWSADGHRLLVVSKPATDDLGAANRLWLVDDDATAKEIRGTAENVQTASWLPDGRVAYFARCTRNAPIVCRDLFVQALDGSKPHNLTDGIDGSIVTGLDNAATAGPIITRSGEILVTVARHFDEQVARIRLADGRTEWIGSLPTVVKAIDTNAEQSRFALIAAERGAATTVRLTDGNLRSLLPVTTPPLQPADWTPLRATALRWTSDRFTIDGLLYLPPGAGNAHRVPLVVDVHGGPAGRFDDSDTPLIRLLLAQGWAVLRANPRGSLGYGIDFLASLQDDLGGGDYRDIMAGVDAALAHAPIDRSRMALIGFSGGASIATVTLGRTTRFKALVAAAPVVDQISEYGTEDSSWYDRWYFGQPWRRLAQAWRQSSLSMVTAARTPLLLLHGESDPVNPTGQSYELYRALHQEGSPVELVLFPRETHLELGRNFYGWPSTEPHHGLVLRQTAIDFLSEAFAGRRPPKPDGVNIH